MSVKGQTKKRRRREIQRGVAKSFTHPVQDFSMFGFEFTTSGRFKGRQYERIGRRGRRKRRRQWLRNTGGPESAKQQDHSMRPGQIFCVASSIISLPHLCKISMADFSFPSSFRASKGLHATAIFRMSEKC
jgi:hypothetical protein